MNATLKDKSNLGEALEYAKRGWPVFPLNWPTRSGQECSCNKPQCKSIGKHPLTPNGFKDATLDPEQIKKWWGQWPRANIGIPTGEKSGFVVLDVDPCHGGNQSLLELVTKHGELPCTIESETGGGGRHFLYSHPGGKVKNTVGILGAGLDVRADGGFIVAPPSLHVSGKTYSWRKGQSPDDCKLAPLPEWLEKLIKENNSHPTPSVCPQQGVIPEGQRNNALTSLAGTMRNRGMSLEAIEAALLVENETKCQPPLKEEEVLGIARSVSKYPLPNPQKTKANSSSEKNIDFTAHFDGLIDLVERDGKIIFLTTEGLKEEIIVEGKKHLPPPKDQILWLVPKAEECLHYVNADNDASLYSDLIETAKSVSILPSENHYHLLAAWIMHTYHLEHENYSPILAFDAVPDRGKSRTGKFLTYIAYRGIRVAEMREANLIRYSTDSKATLFFDLQDAYRTAQKNNCGDIMLNRFEKGTKATRTLFPDKGAFKAMAHFEIFGATIIATNESLDYVLESRGITIVMPEVEGKELKRFDKDIVPEDFLTLKARLVAFRFRHLNSPLPQIEKPAIKRLGDITRPLVRIVRGVKPDAECYLIALTQESETERQLSKAQTHEGQILRCFIEHAERLALKDETPITVKEIYSTINEDRPSFREQISSYKIGGCLSKMGFKRTSGPNHTSAYKWDSTLAKKLALTWGADKPITSPTSRSPQGFEITDENKGNARTPIDPIPF